MESNEQKAYELVNAWFETVPNQPPIAKVVLQGMRWAEQKALKEAAAEICFYCKQVYVEESDRYSSGVYQFQSGYVHYLDGTEERKCDAGKLVELIKE